MRPPPHGRGGAFPALLVLLVLVLDALNLHERRRRPRRRTPAGPRAPTSPARARAPSSSPRKPSSSPRSRSSSTSCKRTSSRAFSARPSGARARAPPLPRVAVLLIRASLRSSRERSASCARPPVSSSCCLASSSSCLASCSMLCAKVAASCQWSISCTSSFTFAARSSAAAAKSSSASRASLRACSRSRRVALSSSRSLSSFLARATTPRRRGAPAAPETSAWPNPRLRARASTRGREGWCFGACVNPRAAAVTDATPRRHDRATGAFAAGASAPPRRADARRAGHRRRSRALLETRRPNGAVVRLSDGLTNKSSTDGARPRSRCAAPRGRDRTRRACVLGARARFRLRDRSTRRRLCGSSRNARRF